MKQALSLKAETWISQGGPPDLSRDFVVVGDKYYTIAEPVTAALLVPFYTVGNLLLGSTLSYPLSHGRYDVFYGSECVVGS